MATYNIEQFQQNFRAHELGKKLGKIEDPVLQELLASEREGDDEDNWEIAETITDDRFNPDILVIQECATQENLDYFNRRWLRSAYATVIVFPTNTDRDQHLAMMLKPGFRVIERRDKYHLEADTVPNERGNKLFARGPAFVLVETPGGYRFWVGTTHQKSKRIDFDDEELAALRKANPNTSKAQMDELIAKAKAKAAADAAAWRNREATRTHAIMKELATAGSDDVLLLGDFNDELGEDDAEKAAGGDAIALAIGPAADGFVLVTQPLADKKETSFGGYYRPLFRSLIDHAIATPAMKGQVRDVQVFRGGLAPVASDHYPVVVTIESDPAKKP